MLPHVVRLSTSGFLLLRKLALNVADRVPVARKRTLPFGEVRRFIGRKIFERLRFRGAAGGRDSLCPMPRLFGDRVVQIVDERRAATCGIAAASRPFAPSRSDEERSVGAHGSGRRTFQRAVEAYALEGRRRPMLDDRGTQTYGFAGLDSFWSGRDQKLSVEKGRAVLHPLAGGRRSKRASRSVRRSSRRRRPSRAATECIRSVGFRARDEGTAGGQHHHGAIDFMVVSRTRIPTTSTGAGAGTARRDDALE